MTRPRVCPRCGGPVVREGVPINVSPIGDVEEIPGPWHCERRCWGKSGAELGQQVSTDVHREEDQEGS